MREKRQPRQKEPFRPEASRGSAFHIVGKFMPFAKNI
jgi:hypothetical protein